METGTRILDLSNKNIKKIDKTILPLNTELESIISLNISGNCLQRLDNIDLFLKLTELNASRNQLLRMYNLVKLNHLVKVNLSNNHILSIEGLKELRNLKHLNLSYNNIKVLDPNHLSSNKCLEYLDLSHNSIVHITNISHLTSLKTLNLRKNKIVNLRSCGLFLPGCLEVLTLAENHISDLNEISNLVQLCNLKELSIAGNPCVAMTGNNAGFNYRPYILNWCMSLRTIDGFIIDDLESLKAEWLYSQGKGRKFRVGEHAALVQYLAEQCPISEKTLESKNENKLRQILRQAQLYQKERQQHSNSSPRKILNRRSLQNTQSLMSKSLDPEELSRKTSTVASDASSHPSENFEDFAEKRMTKSAQWPETSTHNFSYKYPYMNGEPLPTSTTLVPAPDSLISPCVSSPLPVFSNQFAKKNVEIIEDDAELPPPKLKTIKTIALEKEEIKDTVNHPVKDPNEAAKCIQKIWRGYQTRVCNKEVSNIYQQIQSMRFNKYIKKLTSDLEATRATLDKEHQLHKLQMEAINALYRKISALSGNVNDIETGNSQSVNETLSLETLASTCNHLETQIARLQESMQEILRHISKNSGTNNEAVSTQTEIVAVHTPKDDNKLKFPYQKLHTRPSSLPITSTTNCVDSVGITRHLNDSVLSKN